MNRRVRQVLLLIIVCSLMGLGALAFLRYQNVKRLRQSDYLANRASPQTTDADLWARAVEKVREDRGETGNVGIEIPAELRHYDERRWFLATQVAEVKKFNLQPLQDFVDLAAMIQRGEMVSLPAVTGTYILFGVGARVDGDTFTRYVANQNLQLNDEGGLRDAYARLEAAHARLQKEISDLQAQSHFAALKN